MTRASKCDHIGIHFSIEDKLLADKLRAEAIRDNKTLSKTVLYYIALGMWIEENVLNPERTGMQRWK
jgi:hypothetical protein